MTETPITSQSFELSSYSEVVNTAMHLYGSPLPSDLSSGDIPPLISNDSQVRLFPCMKFTCSGVITKLMFIAPVETDETVTVILPIFGLWKRTCFTPLNMCMYEKIQSLIPQSFQLVDNMSNASQNYGIYEIVLTSNNRFESGNILGVQLPTSNGTQQSTLLSVLYQNGGGYCNAIGFTNQWRVSSQEPILPYIAIHVPGQVYIYI